MAPKQRSRYIKRALQNEQDEQLNIDTEVEEDEETSQNNLNESQENMEQLNESDHASVDEGSSIGSLVSSEESREYILSLIPSELFEILLQYIDVTSLINFSNCSKRSRVRVFETVYNGGIAVSIIFLSFFLLCLQKYVCSFFP